MDNILATILARTYSLIQLKHRVRVLKSNLLKTFFASGAPEASLDPSDLNWLRSLPPEFYQHFNKDNVYQIFSDLDDSFANLPVLTMYLTFEPDDAAAAQLGTVCRQQFNNPSLILDIKFDPNLIAGTALVWKGIYRDYSLRLKIENKKSEILEGFRKFLR